MATIWSLLIESTNTRYDQLARQVGRIAEVVNVKEHPNDPIVRQVADAQIPLVGVENTPDLDMVRWGQNVDDLVQRIRQDNITKAVEQILHRFGFNVGYANQHFFMSAFPDYIQQVELLRGCKIPKSLTRFFGENRESTVEHITLYIVEIGEIASNEYLKMRFFPSSLTKNAFT